MKQLIARIDEQLHADLKARAAAEGRSVNAVVNEALRAVVGASPTPGERLERRAAAADVHFVHHDAALPDPERFERALDATRGLGPVLSELLEEDRGAIDR